MTYITYIKIRYKTFKLIYKLINLLKNPSYILFYINLYLMPLVFEQEREQEQQEQHQMVLGFYEL